ncbi:MAG: hypothetical protein AB1603_01195 [Chloroflexota bacterium]
MANTKEHISTRFILLMVAVLGLLAAFGAFLVSTPILRLSLYREWQFYLGLAGVAAWYAVFLAPAPKCRSRNSATIGLVILMLGIPFSLMLDYFIGRSLHYATLLYLVIYLFFSSFLLFPVFFVWLVARLWNRVFNAKKV